MRLVRIAGFLLFCVSSPRLCCAESPIRFLAGGDSESSDAERISVRVVHAGDVLPLPACDAPLHVGLPKGIDARAPRVLIVRFMKRRRPDRACELEVLTAPASPAGIPSPAPSMETFMFDPDSDGADDSADPPP
jgi:hypothetical protein